MLPRSLHIPNSFHFEKKRRREKNNPQGGERGEKSIRGGYFMIYYRNLGKKGGKILRITPSCRRKKKKP